MPASPTDVVASAATPVMPSIVPGEILQPDATIQVAVRRAVDPQIAQGAVRLTHAGRVRPMSVELSKRGRLLELRTQGLEPGPHELVIDELLDRKGGRLAEQASIPFVIVPISGEIPPDLRVEHAVRLVIGELDIERLAPGERAAAGYIDVLKAVRREDGEPVDLAFDENGERIDNLDERLMAVERRRLEKFGRVDETLWGVLEAAKDDEAIPIMVWPLLDLQPAPFEKPSDARLEEPPEGEREVLQQVRRARGELSETLERRGIRPREDKGQEADPFVRALATPGQIRELAGDPVVGAVYFEDPTAIKDLQNSIAIARSDRAHNLGFDGTGIRVAVFEEGPSVTTNLVFDDQFTNNPAASWHAILTSSIIKNTEPNRPHGHAPDCDLYSANTDGNDALEWAVRDEGCTIVSQSFHRASEPGGAGLQGDDILKDWLALRWPYPTIVQAAGNFWKGDSDNITPPEDEYVNHKGYNSLAVGNHNDTAGAMSGDSVFRNPSSSHGDRELPEIAANGTGVASNGENASGTSFAAPAAAGVTALIQDVDGVLCSWPEGCRAILMAAADRNISGQTWWQDVVGDVDARDGAGAVNAEGGVRIAQQRRWRNAPATRRGWDVGTLASADLGADRLSTFRYHIEVPGRLLAPTVKVALAWDSAITTFLGIFRTGSKLTVDFDLLVRDSNGNLVANASSFDNSYEVVEFAASPASTYEIVIRRWSGTDSVWYGIAWNVTGIPLFWPWPFGNRIPLEILSRYSDIG